MAQHKKKQYSYAHLIELYEYIMTLAESESTTRWDGQDYHESLFDIFAKARKIDADYDPKDAAFQHVADTFNIEIGNVTRGYCNHQCPDPGDKVSYIDPNITNPFGICFYDENNDPNCDFCLYCGNPEERK